MVPAFVKPLVPDPFTIASLMVMLLAPPEMWIGTVPEGRGSLTSAWLAPPLTFSDVRWRPARSSDCLEAPPATSRSQGTDWLSETRS